jgi:hypothetical protein
MSKLLLIFAFLFMSSLGFSQEYDDMYFNKRDRKTVKVEVSHTKHVNPEYIARYTSKPKTKVVARSYHQPVRLTYFVGFSTWNRWYDPFWYDPFYQPFYPHYGYYPHYYPYYRGWHSFYYPPYYQPYHWAWHRPYYGWGWYNYGYTHTYHTKTYVTNYKTEVNYQKRRSRGSIHIPKTNREVTNKRVTRDRTISKPTRKTSGARIDWFNSPSKQYRSSRSTESRTRTNYNRSNSNTRTYTPSRSNSSNRGSYINRGNSGSRSSYTPSRSGGSRSSSGSRSRSRQ